MTDARQCPCAKELNPANLIQIFSLHSQIFQSSLQFLACFVKLIALFGEIRTSWIFQDLLTLNSKIVNLYEYKKLKMCYPTTKE